MPKEHKVLPDCCEEVAKAASVFLNYDMEDFADGSYQSKEPYWATWAFDGDADPKKGEITHHPTPASHCPHCGHLLPDLQHRRTKERISQPNLKTGCCDTCHLGLDRCRCMPPEYAYEPIRRPPAHTPRNRIRDRGH